MEKQLKAVVLAAGKGTRMQTEGVESAQGDAPGAGQALAALCPLRPGFHPPGGLHPGGGLQADYVEAAFPGYGFAVQRSSWARATPL
jgi:hypothetical protein